MNQTWDFLVSTGLLVAIAGLLISALKFGKTYIDLKTEELKKNMKSKELQDAVTKAEDSIWTVVMQLANETVDDLKAKAADGKLTSIEIDNLRTTAYTRAKQLMGDATYKLLQEYVGDAQAWMLSKIDAMSRETKQ